MTIVFKRALAVLVLLLVGCTTRPLSLGEVGDASQPRDAGTDIDLASHPDLATRHDGATTTTTTTTGIGALGDGCTIPPGSIGEGPPIGTCAMGLICIGANLNVPGGYCTLVCSQLDLTCPTGSTCTAENNLVSGYCLLNCASDHDCRAGYTCKKAVDVEHAVCTVDGF